MREGGHNIPSDVIRRRYANGIKNLTALYIPLCNYWAIYDNSSADEQIRIIALGGKDITTHIEDTLSYKRLQIMSEIEIKQMQEKINAGILLARKRLIEKVKKEDGELVVVRDGKIVRLKAKDLK